MKKSGLTPMMQQYYNIKEQHTDAILFFRLGDFYEMFADDAIEASRLLNITLTARNKGEKKTPMCGVPFHAAENYIAKLTKLGKKVAICEQVSDPSEPGIVQRKVVRTVTPGTTFNEHILNDKSHNYIFSFIEKDGRFALSFCDITTADFRVTELESISAVRDELSRMGPTEGILLSCSDKCDEHKKYFSEALDILISEYDSILDPYTQLTDHFRTKTLEGFGIEQSPLSIAASGTLLSYLYDTQQNALSYIHRLQQYRPDDAMLLDESTIRNLELLGNNYDFSAKGSLVSILDTTQTSLGGRLLRSWLIHPLKNFERISERHEAVDELYQSRRLRDDLVALFKDVFDMKRDLARLGAQSGNARNLLSLRHSLSTIPSFKTLLADCSSTKIINIRENLAEIYDLIELLEKAIADEPPVKTTEGNMIKDGYHSELDELRTICTQNKDFISELQAKEIESTGISTLKIKYNKVFGYYIEVSKRQSDGVPDRYVRKQTLVNAERFITPELKEFEQKVLTAQDRILSLEYQLFTEIAEKALAHAEEIYRNADLLATLDVLHTFAMLAEKNGYVKPTIREAGALHITEGRHPVIEQMTYDQQFVPNDVLLDESDNTLLLVTGPNMAGKSTYLRQTALIALMAHIGSFIPAKKGIVPVLDRIFTRVGASDRLVKGESTFMVEMQETAHILNNATEQSLIILDEIGRGTSTYDGLSLAWAIMEDIHHRVRAKTLFATHYHELIPIAEELDHAANVSVQVEETEHGVVFLYRVLAGSIDRSYGIEVAKLAGLPSKVTDHAAAILQRLEVHEQVEHDVMKKLHEFPREHKEATNADDQLSLFAPSIPHPVVESLKNVTIDSLTPLEALQLLDSLQQQAHE